MDKNKSNDPRGEQGSIYFCLLRIFFLCNQEMLNECKRNLLVKRK